MCFCKYFSENYQCDKKLFWGWKIRKHFLKGGLICSLEYKEHLRRERAALKMTGGWEQNSIHKIYPRWKICSKTIPAHLKNNLGFSLCCQTDPETNLGCVFLLLAVTIEVHACVYFKRGDLKSITEPLQPFHPGMVWIYATLQEFERTIERFWTARQWRKNPLPYQKHPFSTLSVY